MADDAWGRLIGGGRRPVTSSTAREYCPLSWLASGALVLPGTSRTANVVAATTNVVAQRASSGRAACIRIAFLAVPDCPSGDPESVQRGTMIIGVRTSLPQAAVRVNRSGTRILQIALLLRAMARWHRSGGGGLCLTHWVLAAAGRGGVRLGNHDRDDPSSRAAARVATASLVKLD